MIEFRNINFRYAGGTDAGGLVNINLIIPDCTEEDIKTLREKIIPLLQ